MRTWVPLILTFYAAFVFAQNNQISIPAGGLTVVAGQATTITWTDPSSGTVTIKLQQGTVTPNSGYVLATGIPASSLTATFMIPATVNSHQYTFEIIDDTDPSNYNFSPYFVIQGATGTQTALIATDSGSTSTSSASGSSASSAAANSSSSGGASPSSAASSSASASSTNSPPSNSTTTVPPTHRNIPNNGLSTGAKSGVGVGAAVGALLILAALLFFCLRRRRMSRLRARPTTEELRSPWGRNELAVPEPRKELEGSKLDSPRQAIARKPVARGMVELE